MEKKPKAPTKNERYPNHKVFWAETLDRAISDYDAALLASRHGIHMMWLGTNRPEEYVRGFVFVRIDRREDGLPERYGDSTTLKITQSMDEAHNVTPGLTFTLETLRADDQDTDYSQLQEDLKITLAILDASDGQSPYPPELHVPISHGR